jgi:RNA polymerase sigma-70 factor (ECF subfamily)
MQPSAVLTRLYAVPAFRGVIEDRFDDFYLFSYPRLVAALTFVTGDEDLATDAVDEACARAVERLRRGHDIEVLEAWVRVVARNVARGRLRRLTSERRARRKLVASARVDEVASPGDTAAAIDVRAALNGLSRRQREVVVMHYFLGESIDAIAEELGVPSGTVKSSLHRARIALAQTLTDETTPNTKEQL